MKDVLTKENIKLGVSKTGKKFSNDSNPTPNLQNRKLFDLAFKTAFTKIK